LLDILTFFQAATCPASESPMNFPFMIELMGRLSSKEEIIGMCFCWIECHNSENKVHGREG